MSAHRFFTVAPHWLFAVLAIGLLVLDSGPIEWHATHPAQAAAAAAPADLAALPVMYD
ncbi:hypothetical protein [Dongia sp.]|uniref:hypothetical protein n=1 Tax=Dongia sp. TaxID=1977262 RepID=UPI0035B1683E